MDRRIGLVISQIEADVTRAWETAELAALVNLSASRFRHLFKAETGQTTGQYLRELRLRRAEFLLRTTFLSIKEVMIEAGLTSSSHFVQDFKKKYGVTPSGYRKRSATRLATLVKH
jgi:transcriptional regulator GlxA family with amidase domain